MGGSAGWVNWMTVCAGIFGLVPDLSDETRFWFGVILVLLGVAASFALRRERKNSEKQLAHERKESKKQSAEVNRKLDEMMKLLQARATSEERVKASVAIPLTSLKHKALSLSDDILRFLVIRQAGEPSLPREDTWNDDTDAMSRYSNETRSVYSQQFGYKVLAMHKMLSDIGLKDRELDRLYEHPTNPIGMRIVAERIGALAEQLPDA